MENKEAERAHNCVHIHYKREHKQSHVFLCLSLSTSLVPIHSVGLQGAKEVCAVGTQHGEAWVVTDDYFHWASHGRSCTCQGTQSRWLGPERDWMREWLEKKWTEEWGDKGEEYEGNMGNCVAKFEELCLTKGTLCQQACQLICRASAQTKNWPWLHCYGYLAGIRAAPRIIKDIIQLLVSIERELIWQCKLKSCQLICKHYTSTGFDELGLAAF